MKQRKPVLILGLGNPLMGDDGVGCRVAEMLASDPRLPAHADVHDAGSDLLRWADEIAGSDKVILIDGALSEQPAGALTIYEDELPGVAACSSHVHHLSPLHAIALLRSTQPEIARVHFTLLTVAVSSAEVGMPLSPLIQNQLPEICDQVLLRL